MPGLVQSSTNDCVLAFDILEQKFQFVSPNVNDILGYTAFDFHNNGHLLLEIIDIKDRERIKSQSNELEAGEFIDLNYRIVTSTGAEKRVHEKRGLIEDPHTGGKIFLSIFSHHSSEAQKPGNEIKPQMIDPGFLFEDSPNPMLVYELSSLRILKVNKAAIKKYGYPEQRFIQITAADLHPAGEIEKFMAFLSEKDLSGSGFEGIRYSGIWKHQNINGEIIYAEIISQYIRYENRDCRLVVATDVTETRHYREEAKLSRQFLNSLIDSQTNFLIRVNMSGEYTFFNKQFYKVFGYEKEDILGRHYSFTTIPEEADLCENAFLACLNNPGKVVHLTHKKPDKNGNLHDTEWELISIVDDHGLVTEIQGIGKDITHELRIKKEIRETAEKLDTFIESITDSFFIINNEWRFLQVNKALEKSSGKNREDILGHVIWDVFPNMVSTGFERAYRKAFEESVKVQFTEYFGPLKKWFNAAAYPSPDGLTVFMRDITDEMHIQEELIWTKNSLEALINNTEDQIWSVDKETRYVYMNKAYRHKIAYLTGEEPQEGEFSYLHNGFNVESINEWAQYYQRALDGERYSIVSQNVDPLTKRTLSFEVSFNPIYKGKNQISGVGCFGRNITERLEIEKALTDQNERLRNIASLSSHELRRPVASLLGLMNILDHENFFNPDNKEIIKHLITIGNEIDGVIRQIVDKTFTDNIYTSN